MVGRCCENAHRYLPFVMNLFCREPAEKHCQFFEKLICPFNPKHIPTITTMQTSTHLYLTSNDEVLFDENYRYKVANLKYKNITRKGKSITLIENFDAFCNSIMFNKDVLIKIIGKKLSTRFGIDKPTNLFYVQCETTRIDEIVCEFIKNYLLCKVCDKPEIVLKNKKGKLTQTCSACGNNFCFGETGNDMTNDILLKML
jgi:translation initiation factor 2 beta subunit (eIF-2beta)/eIF-5